METLKEKIKIVSARCAEYWYRELNGKYPAIVQKQKLNEYTEKQLMEIYNQYIKK